ncbi:MAG: LacI family DNA-binding transcriptional regulator [Capsulimonadaceae bacterium]|nr:LacI family DNA-binding transcriptional regulator [Capsulimonadaceae bacterium]
MSVSLADIAAKAEVSIGTVSHVLNGNRAARIAPGTQARIRRIADDMGYRPNVFARHLLGKPNMTLAILFPGSQNPFYLSVARQVEIAAADAGYRLFTVLQPWLHPHAAQPEMWPVDGIFIWAPHFPDLQSMLGSVMSKTPVVHIGYQVRDATEHVRFDLAGGARLAVNHLIERGYRRIACAIPEEDKNRSLPDLRWLAYLETCREIGLRPENVEVELEGNRQTAGFRLGQRLAKMNPAERPEAVFVTGDMAAIGVYHGALQGGLRIPDDLAIVGFDGIEEGQVLDRALTTVLCPVETFGAAAAAVMVARLTDGADKPPQQIMIPTSLIVGQTT